MRKVISWNNKRHGVKYWLSIVVFLIVALNIVWWTSLNKHLLIAILLDNIYELYSRIIPSFTGHGIDYIYLTLITLYLIILLFVWILNHVFGLLPNLKVSENAHRYAYLLKTVVIEDIILGIVLESCALKGFCELRTEFKITSIAVWMYIALILCGSYLYWKCTLIPREMHDANEKFQYEKDYEKSIWYCVSNFAESVSTFSRPPWKGKIECIVVDEKDLEVREGISKSSFFYYLLLIDCNLECNDYFKTEINRILSLPHSNILVLLFGESDKYIRLIDILENQNNVRIRRYPASKHCERLDIESFINNVEYQNSRIKEHPYRFLRNSTLMDCYSKVGEGPKICFDFLKTIMNDLDILPAVYALFDYIDLQYRIQIACTLEPSYKSQCKWMRQKGRVIGNINTMANIIEKPVILRTINSYTEALSIQDFYENIISTDDMSLIKKYLPNYEKDYDRPIQDAIVYLTTSLRNVLRGHGAFEKRDSLNLYSLVFKLALSNLYLVGVNDITLSVDSTVVWEKSEYRYYNVSGGSKAKSSKVLSPFLVADENDNILVFNNWNKDSEGAKNQIEYINYLDGTLILPEYRSVHI
jgi:hypothetical protein